MHDRWSCECRARISDILWGFLRDQRYHHELQADEGTGRRADDLWQHTCFEVFAAAPAGQGYYEFNFSPSLEWAAYRFSEYREGMEPANLTRAPGLSARRTADRLELTAHLHLEGLEELARGPLLHLGLTAVVEDDSGSLSYWALRHGSGNPDFHDPDAFALELSTS